VAAAERVSAKQGDDLLVVEAHAIEDVADVVLALCGIGQAAIGRAGLVISSVPAARAPRDLRSAHLLDGHNAGQRPEVGVSEGRELLLDGLQQVASKAQAGIGAVAALGIEAHAGAIRAAGFADFVVGAGSVPGEADEQRAA